MADYTVSAEHDSESGNDHSPEMDRRGFLKCMAWAGTGLVWVASGGVVSSRLLGVPTAHTAQGPGGDFSFVQISDTHIGFNQAPNMDVAGTLRAAIERINTLQPAPVFMIHTGDLSHGQKSGAFDTLDEILSTARVGQIFYVPGEHDVFADGGTEFLNRYGRNSVGGNGWYSFDYNGVHFIGLINVLSFKEDTMGTLGAEQLDWLRKDVEGLSSSTPLVVFTHIPLWAVYPEWGWMTDDADQALALLSRFGSVTVLNGHIHQVLQKVEGNVTFHTARSTAYPQPAPGTAPAPGPLQVPADQVRGFVGLRQVRYVQGQSPLAVVDSTLS